MDERNKQLTLIVFSNDMDRAIAAFIIATGAASAGMNVTMYFTFWGLALLRGKEYAARGKGFIERMFGWMLPKGPDGAHLSKMHFLGAGTSLMKRVMRTKKIPQLAELMDMAVSLGVKFIACSTSMGMMGIAREELIDSIEIGGVATYLGEARDSAVNLFI
ncbi:DsrE/DsrF/DrsH-like family protein [bacterium]|nr:DsrE/DsrF/DrsH-like family protein [bacterium]